MHFGGAIVNPKWPNIAVNSFNNRISRNSDRTQYLETAIHHSPKRLGTNDFGHARFVPRMIMLVEQPRGLPNRQPACVQVNLVIGQHEAYTLMLDQGFSK